MLTDEQKNNRTEWVKALRSGIYVQGRQVLRSADNEFCCLGVAHEILGGEWDNVINTDGEVPSYPTIDGMCSTLETTSRDRLGLSSEDIDALIRMNDAEDYSFFEIAEVIELSTASGRSITDIEVWGK